MLSSVRIKVLDEDWEHLDDLRPLNLPQFDGHRVVVWKKTARGNPVLNSWGKGRIYN